MDGPPATVIWIKQAFRDLQTLPENIREGIRFRIPLVQQNPHMYQMETAGEFEGLRHVVIGWCKLYYTYWHPDRTIYIEAIFRSGS